MTAQQRTDPLVQIVKAKEALYRKQAASHLDTFCRYVKIPGAPLNDDEDCEEFYPDRVTPAEHHTLLNSKLQEVNDGTIKRLMVFMPPGSAKSTYVSVTFPPFYMANHPNEPVILTSYGSQLADKFGRKGRQLTSSPEFKNLYKTELRSGNRAANDWSLTNDATFMCGGILSGLTGNRAKLIIVDDPVQGREQADSQVIRDKTWDAYQDDLTTRLKPEGAIVIVQTRWHEDDLSGRILPEEWDGQSGWIESRTGEPWYVLCLEAECTRDDDPLGREAGEYLWTDWFTPAHWQREKRNRGSRNWAALYQQRPKPAEGSLIQRSWIQRYGTPPAEFLRIVQSWDTAYKDKEINDPSVCLTWGETRQGYYLLDVFRKRLLYPDVRRSMYSLGMKWNPIAVLIEDKASGQSLIQEAREGVKIQEGEWYTPPAIAIDPKSLNKTERLVAVSSIVEAKLVYLPEWAEWLVDFESELFGYPLVSNDDQVDAFSQFLKWAHSSKMAVDSHSSGTTRAGFSDTGRSRHSATDDLDLGVRSNNDFGGYE